MEQGRPVYKALLLIFVHFLIGLMCIGPLMAAELKGRLGLGLTNQVPMDFPAISFKVQKSNTFALGGLLGVNSSVKSGGHVAGLKVYRLIFEEPQLTFYAAGMGALVNNKKTNDSGIQVDATIGSEFSFAGLHSIGFSFEVGLSLQKFKETVIKTSGNHIVTAGAHFYL